jgi:hypothetical protein
MEPSTPSIFLKISELPKEERKLCLEDVYSIIPEDSVSSPDLEMRKIKTEWRWRFMKLGNKEIVEMSSKNPSDTQRTYMNKFGDWVMGKDVDKIYDTYVTKEAYYYGSEGILLW